MNTTRTQVMTPLPLMVDAHVHFYACFDRDSFLDAALANFQRGAGELGIDGPFLGCLLLAEMAGERWFQRLQSDEGEGRWSFEPTGEEASLVARRSPGGERLLVVAGRQVRTREGLEVLGLATAEEFPDDLTFEEALARVRWSGAVPVLPWGFGKWWFYRGGLIEALLRRPEPKWIFLGDNGGRSGTGGTPRLLREARRWGIPVLPGSDPLPLAGHQARAGSYGFLVQEGVDERQPAAALRQWLRGLAVQPPTFGGCQGLAQFCRDQINLRLRPFRILAPAPSSRPATPRTWTP
ncbi:MAG TPA: hypothetical protein VE685_02715 [Thermoanaerobaculia bacterium]|nr:hypothetical protein [Thermoanaerobaculia bacterium]